MTGELNAMAVAYLLAAQSKIDVSKHADDDAVKALMSRGLLGADHALTVIGGCVADEVMQTARRAMVCLKV